MTEKRPRFAWLKWYPRDFASSTSTWPLIARAVYRELLDLQWNEGGLERPGTIPEDPKRLRDIVHASSAQWRLAWPLVEGKFPIVEGGGRRNPRLEELRVEAVSEYLSRRKGAAATNVKRWGDHSLGESLSDAGSGQ